MSVMGRWGAEKHADANSPDLTKAALRYVAQLAAAIGGITGDEQLLAIGDGLSKQVPAEEPPEPAPPADMAPAEPAGIIGGA